jgi:hypothetical protein
LSEAQRAIASILRANPDARIVLSDAVEGDSYFHAQGADGGTLYVNSELTAFIASQDAWRGRIVTSEALPDA